MDSAFPHYNPEYLAKDYDSFRALMLDHVAKAAPAWSERDPGDIVIALVEVLAYVGDYLSYYQDAVAAEAYLATARRRASVRRHARLVDYRLNEGISARVLVQLAPAIDVVSVARGRALLAETLGLGATVSEADYEKYDGIVFETMHAITLVRDHTSMALAEGEMPGQGDVRLRLRGHLTRLTRGDILLFHHVESDFAHPVRLTAAVADGAATHIEWHAGDAVPAGVPIGGAWTVLGNLVLADHGRTRESLLPPMPADGACTTSLLCGHLAHTCPYDHAAALDAPIAEALASPPDGVVAEAAMVLLERAAFLPADARPHAVWTARHDILHARADERVFVAEPDGNGGVELRFGDGCCGRRPRPEWTYVARYRVGQGAHGNISPGTLKHVVGLEGLIAGVDNPIGGRGGTDPESLDHARATAPLPRTRRIDHGIFRLLEAEPSVGTSIAPAGRAFTAPAMDAHLPERRHGRARGLTRQTMTYAAFLQRMRQRAAREPPLDRLNTAVAGDITNALMSAWARVCDVLAFYQMRIAEEGYIGTAREPRSIRHLAHLLGVTFRPALSASTHLVAKLFEGGRPEGIVIEPGALSVQDAPTNPRQQPAIFESSTRAILRPAWNEITPIATTTTDAPLIWKGCTSLRVVGTATGARLDRALLISAQGGKGVRTWLVTIASVLTERKTETTLLSWDDGLTDDHGPWPATILEVVLFQSSVGLFGRTAPRWDSLPEARRIALGLRAGGLLRLSSSDIAAEDVAWAPLGNDLPVDAEVRAMATTASGILLAGTSKGVFRSMDGGRRWDRAMLAALVPSVFALHVAADGMIYAAGAKAAMFASMDDGLSWTQMATAVAGAGDAQTGHRPPLACTIRAITTVASGSAHLPMIGTDQGVYRWAFTAWTPCNDGFPGRDKSSDLAQVSVRAVMMAGAAGLAATIDGLYTTTPSRSSALLASWTGPSPDPPKPSWQRLPLARSAFALVSIADDASLASVLVGTDDGVFAVLKGQARFPTEGRTLEKDLAGRRVLRLTRVGERLIAATDAGLFSSPRTALSWRACNTQVLSILTFDADDSCRQALHKGRAPQVLLDVLAARGIELAQPVTVSPREQAGTPDIWRLRKAETPGNGPRVLELVDGDPIIVTQPLPMPGPAVVVAASGQLLAAAPCGDPLSRDWPGFHISGGHIYLDRAIEDLEPGQTLALAPADARTRVAPQVHMIHQVARTRRTAFGKSATVTELTTAADPRLQALDLRRTLAHVTPKPLVLYAPLVASVVPVEGDTLTVAVSPDGLQPGHAVLVSGPRPGAAIVRMGGIMAIDGGPVPPPLEQESVLALAAAGPVVFAATASGLIVESSEGAPWLAAHEGLPPGAVVQALAVHPHGNAIVAATAAHGVFCRRLNGAASQAGNGAACSGTNGSAVHRWFSLGSPKGDPSGVIAVTRDGHVIAGTSLGVSTCEWGRARNAPDWTEPAVGGRVHALATGADGCAFAGLDAGAVWARPPDAGWAMLPAIAPPSRVNALAVGNGSGMLVAGCEDGRVLLHSDRSGWRLVCRIPDAPVRTVLIADGRLLIGTGGAGAFECRPDGAVRPVAAPESSDVLALVRTGSGAILAGRDAAIHLAGPRKRVLRRRLFADAGADAAPALNRCLIPASLALIFANAGAKLSPNAVVEVLAPGTRWLVRDRDRDLTWIAERLASGLVAAGAPALLRLYATDRLDVVEAPMKDHDTWTIAYEEGLATFAAAHGQVVLQPARSDQPVVSEIATLAGAEQVPEGTRLALTAPLRRAYDRGRLRISANLVPVTHGETVAAEVLGSGTQTQARQHFSLHRSPVTHLRAAQGIASSLEIRIKGGRPHPGRFAADPKAQVEGQRWRETPSFLLDGPSDRVYVVRRDEQGRTSVHFGDGINGARLPSGSENVVASYRCGAGRAGNVAAGTLVALRRRPIGIRTVTNPMAAREGRDAQSIEDLRIRAPWQSEPRPRIVSLADYATFAAGFLGIGRAQAELLEAEVPTVCLWVVADDGTSANDVQGLLRSLQDAVKSARTDRLALHVGGFATRTFRVAARIMTRRVADPDAVTARARAAVLDAFSPSGASGLWPSSIKDVLEGVAGVAHAEVRHPGDAPRSLEASAEIARWNPSTGRFVAPTLFLVDPTGIDLDVRLP